MNLNIIYEDNHLIAINKPTGILTQSDKTGDKSIHTLTKEYLKNKYRKPGNVYLGILHRLDRPVSGIIIFAKTSKAASRLSKQFKEGEVSKKYYAIIEGETKYRKKQELIHYLKKESTKNIVKVSNTPKVGYKKSILKYNTIKKTINNLSLKINNFKKMAKKTYPAKTIFSVLDIKLITGRSHQIRAQMGHIGHPIVGDIKYGAQSPLPSKGICLIAYKLTFKHPTKKNKISLTIK